MVCSETEDGRGFRQWNEVGRYVKKGAKAFYIIVPLLIKNDKEDKEEEKILKGYKAMPIFRYEDTDGTELEIDNFKLNISANLMNVANKLNVEVSATAFKGDILGSFSLTQNKIKLASPEIFVFLHELSHAVDGQFTELKPGHHADQEITAELSAAVIGHLLGYELNGNLKSGLSSYAADDQKAVFNVLERVEKVVSFIIENAGVKA